MKTRLNSFLNQFILPLHQNSFFLCKILWTNKLMEFNRNFEQLCRNLNIFRHSKTFLVKLPAYVKTSLNWQSIPDLHVKPKNPYRASNENSATPNTESLFGFLQFRNGSFQLPAVTMRGQGAQLHYWAKRRQAITQLTGPVLGSRSSRAVFVLLISFNKRLCR